MFKEIIDNFKLIRLITKLIIQLMKIWNITDTGSNKNV